MSKAQLKKHLIKLTKEQVIDVVMELYEARKEAKEYLDFYINPMMTPNWKNIRK